MRYWYQFSKLLAAALLVICLNLIILAQTDVPRKTVAITYPLGDTINVNFKGTTRFPRLNGSAKVKRVNKSGTRIELTLDNMPRPYELGAAYTTFILWAVTPEGRVENLAEIKRRTGTIFNTRIEVTTPLQTFALIVTAEPHFLVREPSKAVILENTAPLNADGTNQAVTINVQYIGNSSDYYRDPRVPEIAEADYIRTPVSLLGARQAINLARYAGADRDATVEYEYAVNSLKQAEDAWKSGKDENEVDILARQATAAGVRAEEVAEVRKQARLRREEKARNDAEIRRAERKTEDTQREMDELKTELERERRSRELAERDAVNAANQIADLRAENARLRDELAAVRKEAEDAKIKLAKIDGEREALQKQQDDQEKQRQQQQLQEQKMMQIRNSMPILKQSLKPFGTVREDGRGLVLTLPENSWTNPRQSSLTAAALTKLDRIAMMLINNPDYKILIETHTDDAGGADLTQTLTDTRAQALVEKLIGLGIQSNRIEGKGYGSAVPVAANNNATNRAKNRRTEIVLIPSLGDETQNTITTTGL
jgi:outer membrane protein OmpA-like peptidoglycan-associated protein